MSVAIRELGIADQLMLEELLDNCSAGWSDELRPGASGPLAFLADPATFVFGGYVDNEPAGWIWGARVRTPHGGVRTLVFEATELAQYGDRHVRASLIDAATAWGQRNGSGAIEMLTR